MKILYVASEARPFAASGGLADVAGSLPKAIVAEGHECRVVMPYYANYVSDAYKAKLEKVTEFFVPVGWRSQYCGVFKYELGGVVYYMLDNEYYFRRDGLYGHYDDAERFAFFSRAVLELIQHEVYIPEIINSNDWQTALVPVYYNAYYQYHHNMRGIQNVFTIHNIQYQGRYGTNLVPEIFSISAHMMSVLEYDGDVNLMKAAFECADKITTVSPTYAEEIFQKWAAFGLDRALHNKRYKTCGFLNGIDVDVHNSLKNKKIAANFSAKDLSGKKKCKEALLKFAGLPIEQDAPVIGIITRLVEAKGIDLIMHEFDNLLKWGFRVVVLGSGEYRYENFFQNKCDGVRDRVYFYRGYNPEFADLIYAGADMFLMPSKSEPCGLAQMIAMRYGTVPIVHSVGGLKDSVPDVGEEGGLGFTFRSFNAGDMFYAVQRAADVYYKDSAAWTEIVKRDLNADFSWGTSAKLYLGLYKELYDRVH